MTCDYVWENFEMHIMQIEWYLLLSDCNAKFTAKSSLYVHLKKHEGKAKENNNKVTYHCPIDTCDKNYNSKHSLRQHMLKEHTILSECRIWSFKANFLIIIITRIIFPHMEDVVKVYYYLALCIEFLIRKLPVETLFCYVIH